ncbi:19351_t:CDS:2 [Racocetra persica]|uniref:19351_t:CDS:1 n=1 Tax=Racocetra persica TaxID=160502 RepID=A0ACA9KWV3_9GLOM|nr:19351_t:CDS:2 [Racocetra persica]
MSYLQFKVKAFVNVAIIEDVKAWFATFEKHSKTIIVQTKREPTNNLLKIEKSEYQTSNLLKIQGLKYQTNNLLEEESKCQVDNSLETKK